MRRTSPANRRLRPPQPTRSPLITTCNQFDYFYLAPASRFGYSHAMKSTTLENSGPAQALRDEYLKRRSKNGKYSTRAFARDLGVSQAWVSLVMAGKRKLTPAASARIAVTPGLSPQTRQALQPKSIQATAGQNPAPGFARLEFDRFQAISSWEHIAILDLTTLRNFKSDEKWIATRLKLSPVVVRDAIERLVRIGLLNFIDGKLCKSERLLLVPTSKSHAEVRAYHRGMIERGLEELKETSPEAFGRREISGFTIAVNPDRLANAKSRIWEFQKELAAYLSEGPCTELYQLNCLFFPLTQSKGASK